ncbi:MAG: nickel-dependent lactate racemase [Candidatus Atribacteria bacterium]|nr:nickel-dependent lactate racemase [Candidatus Atribacteria bacterium]
MKVSLNYGHDSMALDIPDENYMGTLSPKDIKEIEDPINEVRRALAHPIGSKKLKELVSSKDKVIILASDVSRPSPSSILLPPILKELNEAGLSNDQITIVFGLGVHRKHTEEEKKRLVGEEVYNQVKCIDHDIENCVKIGITKRGNEVSVFKKILEADFIIATGNLEFHYFAGFSGGAKAIAPGVCSRNTIANNHKHFLDPSANAGKIEGNPIREEIEEIGEMVGINFMVNAILNSHKKVVKVVAGDVTKAHREGVKYIHNIFGVKIDSLADIVITSPGGYPKDIDLYQTHKAMENAKLAVKKGGIIIVAGECRDGLGEESFAEALNGKLSPLELIEELKNNFILGRHKASRIANINLNSEIYLVSSLTDEIKKNLFIKSFNSLEEAFSEAIKVQGENARVLVIPYGGSTLPVFKG